MKTKDDAQYDKVCDALLGSKSKENNFAIEILPMHRFGKNKGSRSIVNAWKTSAVAHDATYLMYSKDSSSIFVDNNNDSNNNNNNNDSNNSPLLIPKKVQEFAKEEKMGEHLCRIDVVGKMSLKLINDTLRPIVVCGQERRRVAFKKIHSIKKQIEIFKGDNRPCVIITAIDPRRTGADDTVAPIDKNINNNKNSAPPSEKQISDARYNARVIRAQLLAGIALDDDVDNDHNNNNNATTKVDVSMLKKTFKVCAVARPNNDGASLYFDANWAPFVLKSLVQRGAYAAGICEWSELGIWRGANVHLHKISRQDGDLYDNTTMDVDNNSQQQREQTVRIILRFPKKGAGREGDEIFNYVSIEKKENDATVQQQQVKKIGVIDCVTPQSIAVAVASATVSASAWYKMRKRKGSGNKVKVVSSTKGELIAFASLAKESNGDFSWWM